MKSLKDTIAKIESEITPAQRVQAHLQRARCKNKKQMMEHLVAAGEILFEQQLRLGSLGFASWLLSEVGHPSGADLDLALWAYAKNCPRSAQKKLDLHKAG